jgi:hypothetical protein
MHDACAMLWYVDWPAVHYFVSVFNKRHDFLGKKVQNIKCVF